MVGSVQILRSLSILLYICCITELIESVMYLYQATRDPFLLEVGRDIMTSIQVSARTPCGYASVSEVPSCNISSIRWLVRCSTFATKCTIVPSKMTSDWPNTPVLWSYSTQRYPMRDEIRIWFKFDKFYFPGIFTDINYSIRRWYLKRKSEHCQVKWNGIVEVRWWLCCNVMSAW